MTVNSLVNFGVPSTKTPPPPILRHKFRVSFIHSNTDDYNVFSTQRVRSVTLPSFTSVNGCQPVEIEFIDDITSEEIRKALTQVRKQHDEGDIKSFFSLKIELFGDGHTENGPNVIRTYELGNCLIESFKADTLTYTDPMNCLHFTIEVSYAHLSIYDREMKRLW